MANGVWKGVYSLSFLCSHQLLLNKFFDPSTPSMRKGRDGGKKRGKKEEKNTDENSGHYVIASSRPERRPLERRTLAPINWSLLILGGGGGYPPTNMFPVFS